MWRGEVVFVLALIVMVALAVLVSVGVSNVNF